MNYTETILQKLTEMELLAQQIQLPASTIDKDLLKKKCLELYETILSESTKISTVMPLHKAPPTQDEIGLFAHNKVEEIPLAVINDIPPVEEKVVEEKIEVSDPLIVPNEEAVQNVTPLDRHLHAPTNQDFNKHTEDFLFEKIAKNVSGTPDFIEHLQSHAENLKSTITLNQKIAFVNDLFKENTVDYAKAIDNLNAAKDFNDALRIFGELKYSYNWGENNPLVKDLETLVIKRFQG